MIHHKLFVQYNIEKHHCSPQICNSLPAVGVAAYSCFNLKGNWKHKWNTKPGSYSVGCQISLTASASWEQCGFSKCFVLSWITIAPGLYRVHTVVTIKVLFRIQHLYRPIKTFKSHWLFIAAWMCAPGKITVHPYIFCKDLYNWLLFFHMLKSI